MSKKWNRILLTMIIVCLLMLSLTICVGAKSTFRKYWMIDGETCVTEPAPGKMAYAYPGSDRQDRPIIRTINGIEVSDGARYIEIKDDDGNVIGREFTQPRDFSAVLTYVLTAEEAATADLTAYPVLYLRMGYSNVKNVTASQIKYKIRIYTSETEFIEVVKNPSAKALDFYERIDLSEELDGLTDTTVQKILIYPFHEFYDEPIETEWNQRYFLLRAFGLFDSDVNTEEATLFFNEKLIDSAAAPVSGETPDATIAVIPSVSAISRNAAALNTMAQWIVDNKDTLSVKLSAIVGKITSITAPAVSAQHPTPYIYSDVSAANLPAGYSAANDYIEHLTLNPNLFAAGNEEKNSSDYNQQFNNLATAMRLLSNAQIPFTIAGHHNDIPVSIARAHALYDLYFRLDEARTEKMIGNYSRTVGSGENAKTIETTIDFVRVPLFPNTMTYDIDYGRYKLSNGNEAPETFYSGGDPSAGVKNTWYKFVAGDTKYLVISLEMHPTRNVRTWFKGVVTSNLDYKVIVMISGYMGPDGKLYTIWDDEQNMIAPETASRVEAGVTYSYTAGTAYSFSSLLYYWLPSPAIIFNGVQGTGKDRAMNYFTTGLKTNMWYNGTDGDMFFKKYLSVYPNIVLVIDGAESTSMTYKSVESDGNTLTRTTYAGTGGKYYNENTVRTVSKGILGNTIHTLQLNLTEVIKEAGALMLLKFFDDSGKVEVSCYIPQYDAYYLPENNVFMLDIGASEFLPDEPMEDADGFTIAAITNTMHVAADNTKMQDIANLIADMKDRLNIKMAVHLGGTMDGTLMNKYWITDTAWKAKLNVTGYLASYSANLIYLMSAGAIADKDGNYETEIPALAQNVAAMINTIVQNGIPFSASTYIHEHLAGRVRGTILSNYINPDNFGVTGRYILREVYLAASVFSNDPAINSNTNARNTMQTLVNEKGLVLENNPYIFDHYSYENTYYSFTCDGKDYMVVTLESFPRQAVRTWANNLIAENPDKKVILVVSGMLDDKGEFVKCFNMNSLTNPGTYSKTNSNSGWASLDDSLAAGHVLRNKYYLTSSSGGAVNTSIRIYATATNDNPADGDELYRLVIQKHANIMLVLDGGYINSTNQEYGKGIVNKKMTGVNGNTIHIVQGRFDKLFSDSGTLLFVKVLNGGKTVEIFPYNVRIGEYGCLRLEYPTYDVTIGAGVQGIAPVSDVLPGEKVTLSITPGAGKKLRSGSLKISYTHDSIYYTGLQGADVYLETGPRSVEKILVADIYGKVSFTMPHSDVVITSAEYVDTTEQSIALSAASIRLDGVKGMRFLATFHVDDADTADRSLWEYGVLAIPTDLISAENALAFDETGSVSDMVLNIPMRNYYYYAIRPNGTGYFQYTGVLTGIPEEYYRTNVSAVAYVKYTTDGGATWQYAYSDVLERSYYDVAQRALLSGNEKVDSETALETITKVKATGISINQNDMSLAKGVTVLLPDATVTPNIASDTRRYYTSSNTSVATVMHSSVTTIAAGTTTITVTAADGGFVDSFVLTVTES